MARFFDQRPTEEDLNRFEQEDQIDLNQRSFPKVPEFLPVLIKNLPRYEEYLQEFCIFPFQSDVQEDVTCCQIF